MRFFLAFLLFVGLLFTFNNAYAQDGKKITINVQDEPIGNVFNQLAKLTGVKFFYDQEVVAGVPHVLLNVKNAPLETVLSEIAKQTKLYFYRNDNTISVSIKPAEVAGNAVRRINLSGNVVDEKGEAVIGASIVVDGTTQGTITNIDGAYNLPDVAENATVTISYVGYIPQNFAAGDKTLAKIVLKEDSEQLEEVVVVGYGTVKKRDLTGSVASLNSETITAVPTTTAVEALQGRASGVVVSTSNWSPGASPSVLIRGKRSINASNDPLFVVDGIPVTGGVGEISPSDIESMEVLKDASATAIYGSRGVNGVIIITTKQGKEGRTHVDYNGYVGIQTIQNKLDLMDGAEYAEYTREAYRNSTGPISICLTCPIKNRTCCCPCLSKTPMC